MICCSDTLVVSGQRCAGLKALPRLRCWRLWLERFQCKPPFSSCWVKIDAFSMEWDSADMIAQNGWDPRRKAIVDREYDRQRAGDARTTAIMNCRDLRCVTCCFIYGIRDFGLTSHHDLRRLNIARDAWRKAAVKVWRAEFLRY